MNVSRLEPRTGSVRRSDKLINTKRLAGASVLAVGTMGVAGGGIALAGELWYTAVGLTKNRHISYPSYDTTDGMNKLGAFTNYYKSQSALATISQLGNRGAIHGGRPQIFRSGSGGSFYSTEAVSGQANAHSGPYGTVHRKMLACGPVSTNAYLSCVAIS